MELEALDSQTLPRGESVPKIALFPLLLVAGCIIAGLYGALHNQISYTVSPDYFHALKFDQFNIPENFRNRFGASIVGWLASWWMGMFIGPPVLLVGLIMPNGKTYLRHTLIAFVVVIVTALIVGLTALADASRTITAQTVEYYGYREGVVDMVGFKRAGAMHNASYMGGFLGIMTGPIYLLVARFYLIMRANYQPPVRPPRV